MVGIELNCALVVRQLSVELANGYHAFSPVLRKGFGVNTEKKKNVELTRVLCK